MSPLLQRFAPVGLAELQERASLQTRVDRKYLLPADEVDALLAALRDDVRVLDVDGERRFAYESVYFDTPGLDCYLAAAHRRRRRFKVRTRTYVDSAQCWFEVKTRGPRGTTVKSRVPHALDERWVPSLAFTAETLDAPADALPDLAPTLVSAYDRATLHVPGDDGRDSRATVDTRLRWTDAATGRTRDLAALAVVETKTGATPSDVDRLLWRRGHRPVRLSKYGTGMAALDPHLPATPWRRVLDRHLGAGR